MPRLGGEGGLSRRFVVLAGAATLCGCGAQHALPAPPAAQVDDARRAIAAAGPLVREDRTDAEKTAMLSRVASRVARASEPMCRAYVQNACAFRIGLQRGPEINAFASGRDLVGVTSGMMEAVRNDAELAAVVAHEFGHHLARHIERAGARTQAGALAGALLGAYLGGSGGAQAGAQLGGGAARLVYSQDEEREADYLAAFMVHRAGYDLEQAGSIWIRLAQAAGRPEEPSLLRSHPTGPERLAAWQRTVAEIRTAGPNPMPRRA